jgi:cytochrome c oxidase assembly protein subunit 15
MVSTTTADSLAGEAPSPAAPTRALTTSDPRVQLRRVLVFLLAVGVPLAWFKDPQLVWQPLLPIPLLYLSPRGASRVLVGFVAVLVVIGGGVTTYRVGMAVPDWPGTFQQNMWTYPFSDMLAEGHGVTLEHAHRVWATALGLVAICVLLTCYIQRAARGITGMSWAVLVAIIGQGLLGGTRVLENSQNLAFLHGALAQLVVALIVALAITASRTWRDLAPTPSRFAGGLRALGGITVVAVYGQIALGAWLRHQGQTLALLVHGTLALAVVALVLTFSKILGDAATEGAERGCVRAPLRFLQRLQLWTLIAQFSLGVLATIAIYFISGGMEAEVSVGEVAFATAHVFVGAVLLASVVAGAMFSRRALVADEVSA